VVQATTPCMATTIYNTRIRARSVRRSHGKPTREGLQLLTRELNTLDGVGPCSEEMLLLQTPGTQPKTEAIAQQHPHAVCPAVHKQIRMV
jgi:hypothetical protein